MKFSKIWIRYFFLLIATVILGFIVNQLLYTPIPTLADEDAWLGFYGSIVGATIAGIVTLWGIEYTIKTTILNVKPKIRPVRTNFFLYTKEGIGAFVTNKSINTIANEYAKNHKIRFNEIDKAYFVSIREQLIERHKGTQWEAAFTEIDTEFLYKKVKELCAYKTYDEAIEILYTELPNIFDHGVGTELCDKICERIHHNIEFFTMCDCSNHRTVFYSIYNIGAGNAVDIRIEWDFSKGIHNQLCEKLDFTDEDYKHMKKSFDFSKIQVSEADVMLNTNGENKVSVEVPIEVMLFIKLIYDKSLKNSRENKYMQNNVLAHENQIAELSISCVDIHGEEHSDRYSVQFKMSSTLQNPCGASEESFYLKFNKIKN